MLTVGQVLHNKYSIEVLLGNGGMGVVYGVRDENNQKYAIKQFISTPSESYVQLIQKLIQMGKIEGLAQVYEIFQEQGDTFLCMEYVEGKNGVQMLETLQKSFSDRELFAMLLPVIQGISVLHRNGMLHGDISTDNIMFTSKNQCVLVDYDFLQLNTQEGNSNPVPCGKNGISPIEMSVPGGRVGNWTDVYELCASMYHLLTGSVPPDAISRQNGVFLHPISVLGIQITPQAEQFVMSGLNMDPQARNFDFEQIVQLAEQVAGSQEVEQQMNGLMENSFPYVAKEEMQTFQGNQNISQEIPESNVFAAQNSVNAGYQEDKVKTKKKRMMIAATIIACALFIMGISIVIYVHNNAKNDKQVEKENDSKKEKYDRAIELINQDYSSYDDAEEGYGEAVKLLEKIGEYKDSYAQLYGVADIYVEHNYIEDAVGVYMYLGDFKDSYEKLFDFAEDYKENQNYDKAKEIYEYLKAETSEDGLSGEDGWNSCEFLQCYDMYSSSGEYGSIEKIEELMDRFEKLGSYYCEEKSESADAMKEKCNYQRASYVVQTKDIDNVKDTKEVLVANEDYEGVYQLAKIYIEVGEYEKAADLFKELSDYTGNSYEAEIRECQLGVSMDYKFENFDMEGSSAYDSSAGSMQNYVSIESVEAACNNAYATYEDDNGETIVFSVTQLDGKDYGVKVIRIMDVEGSEFSMEIYYQDNPKEVFTVSYTMNGKRMVKNDDGEMQEETWSVLTVNGKDYYKVQ